jgi:hypothetical protein
MAGGIFNIDVLRPAHKLSKSSNIVSKTIQIYKKKGHRITEQEIKDLVKDFEEKAKKKGEKIKLLVNGVNGDQRRNLKIFDGPVKVHTYDDYNQGNIFESANFIKFYQVEITMNKYI